MKQVDKHAYQFEKYSGVDRFASYYYQLREILTLKPNEVLEVGVGDGVIGHYLKTNTPVSYRSLDIAEDLKPDILGSIKTIPLPEKSVDVVVAFEVLEHLPFDDFEMGVQELARVAKSAVILSLPHFGPSLRLSFKIPFCKEVQIAWKLPYHPTHVFNGQHYWEIGKRGYEVARIRMALQKYFTIEKEFVPYENQYHHFFVLRPLS